MELAHTMCREILQRMVLSCSILPCFLAFLFYSHARMRMLDDGLGLRGVVPDLLLNIVHNSSQAQLIIPCNLTTI